MVTLLALLVGAAQAQAVSISPTASVVGQHDIGVRPGLRVGFEPLPSAALEVQADSSLDGEWDAGLGIAGRWWVNPADVAGQGIFLLGRFNAGFSGYQAEVGPWTGLSFGFGGRPVPLLNLEAAVGPEWSLNEGGGWRTELSLGVVLGKGTVGGEPGKGNQRHRPRKIPQRGAPPATQPLRLRSNPPATTSPSALGPALPLLAGGGCLPPRALSRPPSPAPDGRRAPLAPCDPDIPSMTGNSRAPRRPGPIVDQG